MLAQPVGWFPQHAAQLVTGRRATTLDANRQRVGFDDGSVVQYDELLLAFGGMVAPLEIPGAGLPGLYYLRSLHDAESIITRAKSAAVEGRPQPNGRGRAVVIGGGTLGRRDGRKPAAARAVGRPRDEKRTAVAGRGG